MACSSWFYRRERREQEREREKERERKGERKGERSGHPLPSLTESDNRWYFATHGKSCVQTKGYSAPTAHYHLPFPRTLGLNVISISERWRHAHSLSSPSLPTTLRKETSNIHWKGCLQRSPCRERKREGRWKEKERRRKENADIILWKEKMIGSHME